jgi:hypothetical protein
MQKIKLSQSGFAVLQMVLILIVVAIVGFAGWYVYKANKDTNSTLNNLDNSEISITATPTPSPSPNANIFDEEKEKAEIIDYMESYKGACQYGEAEVEVLKVVSSGYGYGSYLCGSGYKFVVQKIDNQWQEIFGYQDGPYCKHINEYKVSKELFSECKVDAAGLYGNTESTEGATLHEDQSYWRANTNI